jgi:hypothetical protein
VAVFPRTIGPTVNSGIIGNAQSQESKVWRIRGHDGCRRHGNALLGNDQQINKKKMQNIHKDILRKM